MARGLIGTAATNTLAACLMPGSFSPPSGGAAIANTQTDADIAFMVAAIRDDLYADRNLDAGGNAGVYQPPMQGWSRNGQLYIPNRGWLKCLPGDVIAVDPNTGWPILISAKAAASASFVNTAT